MQWCCTLVTCTQVEHNSFACRYAEFKVVGSASVHLSGYYMPEHGYGE